MKFITTRFIPLDKLLKNPGAFVVSGDLKGLKSLISKNPDALKFENKEGNLLAIGASHGKTEICEYLISEGVLVDSKDKLYKSTPIMLAAAYNNLETVSYLLKKGANINQQDVNGVSALHVATSRMLSDMVKLLLEKGADTEVKDKLGRTPFDVAKEMKLDNIAKLFK